MKLRFICGAVATDSITWSASSLAASLIELSKVWLTTEVRPINVRTDLPKVNKAWGAFGDGNEHFRLVDRVAAPVPG